MEHENLIIVPNVELPRDLGKPSESENHVAIVRKGLPTANCDPEIWSKVPWRCLVSRKCIRVPPGERPHEVEDRAFFWTCSWRAEMTAKILETGYDCSRHDGDRIGNNGGIPLVN